MKKLTAILICLILLAAPAAVCYADDLYIIDPYTGEIISSESGYGVNYVRYSDRCIYNIKEDTYTFSLPSGTGCTVASSVYDGMVVQGSVRLSVDNLSLVDIYRDGELVSVAEYENLQTPGTYIVRDLSNDTQLFTFTIVGKMTGALYAYRVPAPFSVYRVQFEGNNVNTATNLVSMSEEGEYYIEYGDYNTGKTYELNVLADHIPPELEISGVNEKNIASTTVILGKREANSTLTMTRNGEPEAVKDELDQPGEYVLTYTDEAGNSSLYHFTIRLFFDTSAKMFLLLFLLVAAAAGAFMIYSRKHMRVR